MLIEPEISRVMKMQGIKQLSVYPEGKGSAPAAARVLHICDGLAHHDLLDQHGQLLEIRSPELIQLQRLVLSPTRHPQRIYTD